MHGPKWWAAAQWMALAAILLGVLGGCASWPSPAPRVKVSPTEYDADFDRTWNALSDVLSEQRYPIRAFEKDSGLVTTDFVDGSSRYIYRGEKDDDGQEVSEWVSKTRYFLNIRVRQREDGGVEVDVLPHVEYMRYQYDATLRRSVEVGWELCDSHGDIEKEIYDALSAKLGK